MKLESEQLELAKQLLPEIDWSSAGEEVTIDRITELKSAALITKELHKKEIDSVFGRTIGPVENELKGLLGEEGKGKTIKEILPAIKDRFSTFTSQLEDLKSTGGKDKDSLLKELTDYKTLAKSQEDQLKEWQVKVEEAERSAEAKFEAIQLNHALTSLYDKLAWTDDADEYVKEGIWKREIEGKYQFKKEGDKVLVYDSQGGIVQSGTGHMTADDLFVKTIEKANRLKKNGATGAGATGTAAVTSPIKLDERARKRLEEIQKRAAQMK